MNATRSDPAGRHRGRVAALQLLYQREVGGAEGPRRRGVRTLGADSGRSPSQQRDARGAGGPRETFARRGLPAGQREVGGVEGPRRRGAARPRPQAGGAEPAASIPPLGAAPRLARPRPQAGGVEPAANIPPLGAAPRLARPRPQVGGAEPAANIPPLGAGPGPRRTHAPVGGAGEPRVDRAIALYWRQHPAPAGPRRFAEELLRGTVDALERIDPLIESAADNWRLSRMAVIDRLVLRLAVYELLAAETPAAVVIDEAIELARTFGDEPSPRFVNGVLDAVRRRLDEDLGGPGPPAS